jgi:hypothetical protein
MADKRRFVAFVGHTHQLIAQTEPADDFRSAGQQGYDAHTLILRSGTVDYSHRG